MDCVESVDVKNFDTNCDARINLLANGKYFTKVFSKKYFENTILFCILKILL